MPVDFSFLSPVSLAPHCLITQSASSNARYFVLYFVKMDQHDLLLIGDASSNCNSCIRSLTALLTKIISISAYIGCFSRIGVLAYRSYQADSVLEWSGWLNQGQHESSQEPHPDLIAFAKRLRENVRRNRGEAVKTALAKACQVMRADAKTPVFLCAKTCPTASYFYGSSL